MKTTDLIPLILLQLNEGDKYGLELTKAIETKSNGKIIIKQPTLYTILKKLEKSKFIKSYWEDSEIGGKRHYYKITDNGKSQVSTLPSFDALISSILSSEDNYNLDESNTFNNNESDNQSDNQNENNYDLNNNMSYSIMDLLDNQNSTVDNVKNTPTTPSILPSEEVFSSNSIDTATETEINMSNSDLLKSKSDSQNEHFANNENVSKFTEKHVLSDEYKEKLQAIYESSPAPSEKNMKVESYSSENLKYVDYRDFKTNSEYVNSKKTIRNLFYKVLATSGYLLLMTLISAIVTSFTGKSPLYYIILILNLSIIVFCPSLFAFNLEKLRLKYEFQPYNYNLKKRFTAYIIVEIVIIIVSIILNLCMGIKNFFAWSNFANFYTIILSSTTIFADLLFYYIFMRKINKNNK